MKRWRGFDPVTSGGAVGMGPLSDLAALPALKGTLVFDYAACRAAASDFGHIVDRHPLAVLKPRSARDVAVAVRYCRDHKISVAMRGQGHSTNGQAQARGGLVIDGSGLNALHGVDQHRIVVGAGATWREVLAATLP